MGVRGALFILPVIALINYSIIAVAPLLAVVRVGKILENSTDYSIQNTLRQALFLPTTREAKYKAKAAIDTFFTRDRRRRLRRIVVSGRSVGVTTAAFAGLNVALTVLWLWVAGQIAGSIAGRQSDRVGRGRRGAAADINQHLQLGEHPRRQHLLQVLESPGRALPRRAQSSARERGIERLAGK